MTISYKNYQTDTHIVHGSHEGKLLVLGFLVTHEDLEKRYALHADGKVKETEWRKRNEVWFNKPGTKWFPISCIPDDAEFIGQYVDDIF